MYVIVNQLKRSNHIV